MPTTAQLTVDDATVSKGDIIVFRPVITLDPGKPATTQDFAGGHLKVTLLDGRVVEADSANVAVTTLGVPADEVDSVEVTFNGQTLSRRTDGTYTAVAP